MKILAIHSGHHEDQNKRSAVDTWRIGRPIRELKKNTDWQIDERTSLIPSVGRMKNVKEFTSEELQKAFDEICQYDIVFSAYQSNPSLWTLLQVAHAKAGTQYVMDVDDDMFAINPDNPVWMNVTDENVYHMQRMIAHNPHIVTTNDYLAGIFRVRRPEFSPESVHVVPNYIADDYREYDPTNGDKVVIGFFGGSSHYGDLHRTGVLEAIQKLMHKYKHVYFKSIGMPVDTYLPRARYELADAKRGDQWTKEIFPSMNLDIAIGPLEDNLFNKAKSNIKWQESTRAGAAFVASNVGPYATVNPLAIETCENTTEDWYGKIERLILDATYRAEKVKIAREIVQKSYRLEDHWWRYRDLFEKVHKAI